MTLTSRVSLVTGPMLGTLGSDDSLDLSDANTGGSHAAPAGVPGRDNTGVDLV